MLFSLRCHVNKFNPRFPGHPPLDNFGARYNASSFGRFTSPDWSSVPVPVPFADLGNPQSLNLYSYVSNNPVSRTDPLGHCWHWIQWACNGAQRVWYGFTSDYGFITNAQVTEIRKQQTAAQRKWLIDHNVVSTDKAGNTIDWSKASDKEVNDKAKQIAEQYVQYVYALGMLAGDIAGGHAFDEHARPGQSRQGFYQDVENTLTEPSEVKVLPNGRKAFWSDKNDMVVISDPNHPDGGTAFYPDRGKAYFDELKGWPQK